MRIAVGIVFHGTEGIPPVESDGDVEVLSRVNGRNGAGRTRWLGFGANHNELIQQAEGADWYVALNPDVEIATSELVRMIEIADDQGFAVVGPRIRYEWGVGGGVRKDLPSPSGMLRETFLSARAGRAGAASHPLTPAAWVPGSCLAIRMDARPRFDEGYFMYFEDVDLCARMRAAGRRVGASTGVTLAHATGWSSDDPLRWRRGVEFARSAERFAVSTGHRPGSMRLAGLLRFGSRVLLRGSTAAERVASRSITRGFALAGSAPGISELAAAHNQASG